MDEKDVVPITSRDLLVKLGPSAVAYLAGGGWNGCLIGEL